MTVGSIPSP